MDVGIRVVRRGGPSCWHPSSNTAEQVIHSQECKHGGKVRGTREKRVDGVGNCLWEFFACYTKFLSLAIMIKLKIKTVCFYMCVRGWIYVCMYGCY
jgi:hypothetical protein